MRSSSVLRMGGGRLRVEGCLKTKMNSISIRSYLA